MAGGYGTSSDYGGSRDGLMRILQIIKRCGVRIPLIDLAYLAAVLGAQGHDVRVIYGREAPEADLYLVYVSLVEFDEEMKFLERTRRQYPGARLGLIGTFASAMPSALGGRGDFIVGGESEAFFLHNRTPLDQLAGVYRAPILDDLGELPYPDWTAFEMKRFVHRPFFGNVPVYPVLGSRGCPFSCRYYCAYPLVAGGRVRYRSVDNVVAELLHLRRRYGAKAVLFRDPNFTLDTGRTGALCRRMIELDLRMHWACETHLSRLDEDLLDLMHLAGCRAITTGIESRTKDVLKAAHRPDCGEAHLVRVVRHAERIGVRVMAGYVLGNTADTPETIRHTVGYARWLNTSYAQFSVLTPYPGTPFFRDVEGKLLTRRWTEFDTYTPVFRHGTLTPQQIHEFKCQAFREYYFRPRWIFGKFLRGAAMDAWSRWKDWLDRSCIFARRGRGGNLACAASLQ
jgi:radical SAM superfamily enzyme YgiQ (UPF0313 family)